ncbi:MAG TPA: GntR family transcriptional regulator [Candidatus Binatia bacterium]|nr:GntR family transcriptional regulator [Candidatus Binatia bacterium]
MTSSARVEYRHLIKNQRSKTPPLEIVSVEDGVYRALRQEIGRLQLAPGERLRLEELAERFQVSPTPIRHALRRLESEGLVAGARRRGSFVAPLSVEELEEIQAIRLGLETFLSRHGAEGCTEAALAEMTRAREEMERAFRAGDLDAYISSFWSLRDACYRCAGRPRLQRALEDQRIRVERYILFLCRDPEAFAELRRGPDTLLEACRARDGEAAEAATRDALLWVLAKLRRLLDDVAPPSIEASA